MLFFLIIPWIIHYDMIGERLILFLSGKAIFSFSALFSLVGLSYKHQAILLSFFQELSVTLTVLFILQMIMESGVKAKKEKSVINYLNSTHSQLVSFWRDVLFYLHNICSAVDNNKQTIESKPSEEKNWTHQTEQNRRRDFSRWYIELIDKKSSG